MPTLGPFSGRRVDPQLLQLLLQFGLLQNAQQEQQSATQANEERYLDILNLLGLNRQEVLDDVSRFGQSRRDEINARFDTRDKNVLADLAQRGLSGSTLRGARLRDNDERRERLLTDVEDALLANRIQQNRGTIGDITGVMERRTDAYPDIRSVVSAVGQSGQAGGGLLGGGLPRSDRGRVPQLPSGSVPFGGAVSARGAYPARPQPPSGVGGSQSSGGGGLLSGGGLNIGSLLESLLREATLPQITTQRVSRPSPPEYAQDRPSHTTFNPIQSSGSSGQYQSPGAGRPVLGPQIGFGLPDAVQSQLNGLLGQVGQFLQQPTTLANQQPQPRLRGNMAGPPVVAPRRRNRQPRGGSVLFPTFFTE